MISSGLGSFPKGLNALQAQARIAALEKEAAEQRAAEQRRVQETTEWGAVAASTDMAAIEAFLKQWPNGQHAEAAARVRIRELKGRSRGVFWGVLMLAAGVITCIALYTASRPYTHTDIWLGTQTDAMEVPVWAWGIALLQIGIGVIAIVVRAVRRRSNRFL